MKRIGMFFWAVCLSGGGCVEDHRAGQGCQSDIDCPAGQRCGIYAWCEPVVDGAMADSSAGEDEASGPVEEVDESIVDAPVADGDMAAPSDAEDGWQDGACHCNGLDEDADGQVDEDCALARIVCADEESACGLFGEFECVDGVESCRLTQSEDQRGMPRDEVCNGADDDCDGIIDNAENSLMPNSLLVECGTEDGTCEKGVLACRNGEYVGPCVGEIGPSNELCDGLDNDCDRRTDEDFNLNTLEHCGACNVACELDNATVVCTNGVCTVDSCRDGFADKDGDEANGCECEVRAETCDGVDNDCDGEVDEDFWQSPLIVFIVIPLVITRPMGSECNVGVGNCRELGTWICSDDGMQGQCDAEPDLDASRAETCNGRNDDCDEHTDEAVFSDDDTCLGRSQQGQLVEGQCICNARGDIHCAIGEGQERALPPGEEQPGDGRDNDCDSAVDEAQ